WHGPVALRRGRLLSQSIFIAPVPAAAERRSRSSVRSRPTCMTTRHFLSLDDLGADGIRRVITNAIELKARRPGEHGRPLAGRTLAMLFEKSSTRTRVSFETGMT